MVDSKKSKKTSGRPKGLKKTGGRKKGTPNKARHALYLARVAEEKAIADEIRRNAEILERRKAQEAVRLRDMEEVRKKLEEEKKKQEVIDAKKAEIKDVQRRATNAICAVLEGKPLIQNFYHSQKGCSILWGTRLTAELLRSVNFDILPHIPYNPIYSEEVFAIYKSAAANIEILEAEFRVLSSEVLNVMQ